MGAPKYDNIRRRVQADQRDKESRMNQREIKDYGEINTKEMICKHCGFKAKYKFLRCPNCEKKQE